MSTPPDGRRSVPLSVRLPRRLLADAATGCHNWTGARDPKGYGRVGREWPERGAMLAHRAAYELAKGPIPAGLVIDHLCRNPSCCNPDHLEAVTMRENSLRGVGPAARNASVTQCPAGHPYDDANTLRKGTGQRYCRACALARYRRLWPQYRVRRYFRRLKAAGVVFVSSERGIQLHQPGKPVLVLTYENARRFAQEIEEQRCD